MKRTKAKRGESIEWLRAQAKFETDDCILWPFGRTPQGYGNIRVGATCMGPHRLMCIMVHGDPPEGHTDAAHSCGVKLCCNPRHIRHATAGDNQREKISHGTVLRGENHPRSKLRLEDVLAIRRGGKPQSEWARELGVSEKAISLIVHRVNWASV